MTPQPLTQTERLEGYVPAIGGASGPKTHGGAIERPADMPTKRDANYVATNKRTFLNAIEDKNAIVYIDDSFTVNILHTREIAPNVTIIGGHCDPSRTENDGYGPEIHFNYFTDHMLQTRESLTLYGVNFRGPTGEYFDPREWAAKKDQVDDASAYYTVGVWAFPDKGEGQVRVIGSRFSDWPQAGLMVGAKHAETNALVSRSTFVDCMMETLGYGITQLDGTLVVERCDFDRCRHAIAGFGYPTERLILADSVFGPGPWAGHVVDRHCLANAYDNGDGTAGQFSHIWRCTAMSHEPGKHIKDVAGYDQEFFAIRGASVEQSYVDKVDFWAPKLPSPTGENGDALRQETALLDGDGSQWVRLDLRDNATGGNNGPTYGATMATDDSPGGPADDEFDELRVIGYGSDWTNYRLVIDGEAKRRRKTERSDLVKTTREESVITGKILGGVDTFALPTDSDIVEAWISGTARVERNGQPVDLTSATTAAIDRRIDNHSQRLAALEQNWKQLREAFTP